MKFDKFKVKKILVIKPSAIGDVLLSTPVIENLRHNFAKARIDFLTQFYCRDMVTENPYLDNVYTYDAVNDNGCCILKNVRGKKYDLVIDLFGNPRTALITFYSGAKYKVGFMLGYRKFAYNIKVKPRSREVHNIDFNLDALRILDLNITTDKPVLFYNKLYDEKAEKLFNETGLNNKPVIAINACGTWETKVWSSEYFVKLINLFGDNYNILLLWGNESEKLISENIKTSVENNVHMLPQVGLKELAAILKKCKLLITNDTGPMHIAWVQGVNTAAIFGPTNSKLHGPRSANSVILINEKINCLGCDLTDLKKCMNEHKCMVDLTPEEVFDKVSKLIVS